ncbi:MAG: hypothetical protein OXJ52_05905 [Oligoflexia bacterium]|nr:hypothetical protein [Oligoflexia bacterium]
MNKYLILFLLSFLFLSACNNEGSVPVIEGVSNGGESLAEGNTNNKENDPAPSAE